LAHVQSRSSISETAASTSLYWLGAFSVILNFWIFLRRSRCIYISLYFSNEPDADRENEIAVLLRESDRSSLAAGHDLLLNFRYQLRVDPADEIFSQAPASSFSELSVFLKLNSIIWISRGQRKINGFFNDIKRLTTQGETFSVHAFELMPELSVKFSSICVFWHDYCLDIDVLSKTYKINLPIFFSKIYWRCLC
jgi:hypothetical protein